LPGCFVAMLRRRAVMVCATKQHTGKTSVSMALLSKLRDTFGRHGGKVGYMKPVGQEWVEVAEAGAMQRADKDAALAHQYFGLTDSISCVSPVVIGRGDTKAFLDGTRPDLSDEALAQRLQHAYTTIAAANDFVVVEGTGHCGVGAVLGWNNARVAATLGIDVVLVANGGVGSTFDELALNVIACRAERANVAGIIINKCAPHKVEEVAHYLQRASDRFGWGVPVLACVPYGEDLDRPSVLDLVHQFEGGFSQARYDPSTSSSAVANISSPLGGSASATARIRDTAATAYTNAVRYAAGYGSGYGSVDIGSEGSSLAGVRRDAWSAATAEAGSGSAKAAAGEPAAGAVLLAGGEYGHRRFTQYKLVSASLERFMGSESLVHSGGDAGSPCFVTHISRSDIIHGLLGHQAVMQSRGTAPFEGGLILAGSKDERPQPFVEDYIRAATIPILRSNLPVTQTLSAIKDLKPKMQAEDGQRVRQVIDLYAPYLDEAVERLLHGEDAGGRK